MVRRAHGIFHWHSKRQLAEPHIGFSCRSRRQRPGTKGPCLMHSRREAWPTGCRTARCRAAWLYHHCISKQQTPEKSSTLKLRHLNPFPYPGQHSTACARAYFHTYIACTSIKNTACSLSNDKSCQNQNHHPRRLLLLPRVLAHVELL
jgi:hypothetical protein